MAWRDLFRNKDDLAVADPARPSPSPPILFGRLPAHRDFVRAGPAQHGWFERWLEEGLEQPAGVKARHESTPPASLIDVLGAFGSTDSSCPVPP
jgi:hypothetical protein